MSGRRKPHRRSGEARRRPQAKGEAREHLWFSLPVRCWCGEQHVLGQPDEEFPEDDANEPIRFDYLDGDDDEGTE